uniref:Venom dipeptidyl peptidase 4 n=2 Tax=Culicoides sonorensis TaxID=179676 RepID=A0A336M1A4_CULSO
MSNSTFKTLSPTRFSLSADKKYLLLTQNVQKLYRYSYLAQYIAYDVHTSETIQLSHKPTEESSPFLLHAQFTPHGHSLILVHKNDIYYMSGPKSQQSYRITKTAVPDIVYNGVPDWLYEEEILHTNTALWLSNDGHLMLYAVFNDSNVQEQKYTWYGTNDGNMKLYPEIKSLRYPKPGTPNPTVKLRVADLAEPKSIRTRDLTPPPFLMNDEHYFTSAAWISQTEVCIVWLNRPQNISIVTLCKSPMWYCQETHRINGDNRGWVDILSVPYFALNGSSYITIQPLRDGGAGHFKQLIHVEISRKKITPLTHGRSEVNKIVYWDQTHNYVYFLGTPQHYPSQQHLYRADALPPKSGAAVRPPVCLTCEHVVDEDEDEEIKGAIKLVTVSDGWDDDGEIEITTKTPKHGEKRKQTQLIGNTACLYHNVIFPPEQSNFALFECLGPDIPTSAIYRIFPDEDDHPLQLMKLLINNTRLKQKMSRTALPQVKTYPVMISGGYYARVRLYLPPGLREDEITRYPMVVNIYSGPGTQLITEKWNVDWNTYLAGTKDYIITQIDGRGSSGQGYQLLHEVYRRLGTVEISDQLEVTEYLRDNIHFVDKRRVGVWGWSYGGFASILALASTDELFQCGISVAPVTNWKLYDSAYTEKFMGLPNVTDNYKGYEEGDLSKYVEQLKDKQFLLIHGTADDNVHFQQSMMFAKALAAKGALFKQQIYPDEGHSLSGVKRHLYRSMTIFFEECFKKQVPHEVKSGLGNGGTMEPS